MLLQQYVTQPVAGVDYLSLFRTALQHGPFTQLDAAVAYATLKGVNALEPVLSSADPRAWAVMRKRWLVGIDWCRSDPVALERLSLLPTSTVKIPDGAQIIRRRGCTPTLPFHPKTFVLKGPNVFALLAGSGNLSRNGLTRGHECGSLLLFKNPLRTYERGMKNAVQNVAAWFDNAWGTATSWNIVNAAYTAHHDAAQNMRSPTPTDDDAAPTDRTEVNAPTRRAIPPERLRQLRAGRHLWIEGGNLTKNRGPNQPGNQLMMSPMTRVFFGFDARDLDPDTTVGDVAVQYGNYVRSDCSLRFSNNSMDVLTLPVPGAGGPVKYDQEVLHFEKRPNNVFLLTLGSAQQARTWLQQSQRVGGLFTMTSGRQWGVS